MWMQYRHCVPPCTTVINRDYPPIVRYYAAYALGILGNAACIAPLEQVSADDHVWVLQMVNESLDKLR